MMCMQFNARIYTFFKFVLFILDLLHRMVIINLIAKVRLPQNVQHAYSLSEEALKADIVYENIHMLGF